MRRRTGFTLVEVLVAMALILFIMTILGAAFSAATQTVSDLKSAGDLAERLRGAATVIKRDLEADHCFDGLGQVLPIRTVFGTSLNPNQPPAQGFFRIYEQTAGKLEGTDVNGLPSYYQTTASLAYTISLNGTRRDDFLSAYVPGSPLTTDPTFNTTYPPDQRYEDTWLPGTTIPTVYNSPSAEAALFLVRTNDVTDASGSGALPLYGLYRRQLLTVPPTAPRGATPPAPWVPNPPVPSAQAPNYVEVSTFPSGGNLAFNRLADLTMPVRRFWMSGAAGAAYQAGGRYATMYESSLNPNYQAADLLMPDVISMDVRVLVLGNSDFLDLFDPGVQQYAGGNPAFTGAGPRVFDTWSSQTDAVSGVNYGAWMTPGSQMSIPLYKNANGAPISVQAIQITLRVWDFKTKKTRQVTIVQQM